MKTVVKTKGIYSPHGSLYPARKRKPSYEDAQEHAREVANAAAGPLPPHPTKDERRKCLEVWTAAYLRVMQEWREDKWRTW